MKTPSRTDAGKTRPAGTDPDRVPTSRYKQRSSQAEQPAGRRRRADDHPLVQLQRTHGNRTVQRLVDEGIGPVFQPTLRVGASNDVYEREADRVAERVMGTSEPERRRRGSLSERIDRRRPGPPRTPSHAIQQRTTGTRVQRHGTHEGLTAAQKYEHTLEHAGTTRAAWESDLVPDATFLGVSITRGIHQELVDRLAIAENHLRSRHPGHSDAEIAGQIGLYSISGRRVPGTAVGGSRISNHAFGLAIDVNYRGNPFIARNTTVDDIIARATEFMLGTEIRIRRRQPGTTEEIRARYERASDALRAYFALRSDRPGLTAHLSARGLSTDTETVDRWIQRITTDYQNPVLRGEFATTGASPDRDPAAGFIDLSQELVAALADQAGLFWGGRYRHGKDIMHFGWRRGTVRTGHRV